MRLFRATCVASYTADCLGLHQQQHPEQLDVPVGIGPVPMLIGLLLLLHLQDIGTGSFGQVFLARNVRTNEQVLQLEAGQQQKQLYSNSSSSHWVTA